MGARETVRIDLELKTARARGRGDGAAARRPSSTRRTRRSREARSTTAQLQELPFTFRTFNTSPVDTIAVLPEVQKGTGDFDFSLSGGQSYQNEVSVDGISSVNVRRNGIGSEDNGAVNIFPSVEGIEEIRVSSINNNAELATDRRHHHHHQGGDQRLARQRASSTSTARG